jgi:hypothetical protein
MESHDDFQDFLRKEVITTGQMYDRAYESVRGLLNRRDVVNAREIADAAEELLKSGRVYIGALRRLAHFAAHEEQRRQKSMAQPA